MKLNSFYIIGITVRTINKDGQAGKDIKGLWDRFFKEQLLQKIPNKINTDLYNVYTNYESDHLNFYDCFLGCKVSSIDDVPEGMQSLTITTDNYKVYTSKGILPKVVLNTWESIWASSLKRTYNTDFDVYGKDAQNPEDAVVETFVSIP